MKSPRKTEFLRSVPALVAFSFLLFGAIRILAQDPPTAPVPKVKPPPISQAPAAPQQQTPPANPGPSDSQATLRVNVNLVILPVTVKDGAGHLVADLTRTEFRILDDNVEQRLEYF